jgi:hypothetical protein
VRQTSHVRISDLPQIRQLSELIELGQSYKERYALQEFEVVSLLFVLML